MIGNRIIIIWKELRVPMTTEPQFNELVIYTREVLTRFLEKRDPLLKLIEKDLIKLSKKQHSHIRHPNDGEKTLFEELDKILHRLVEFNIECGFKFICDFESKYNQIYNRDVHPDIMKREMIEFLSNSVDDVIAYAKQLDELYKDISSFYIYLKELSPARTEYTDALEKQMDAVTICKHQCYENIAQFREAIAYFNVPTECPPHL